ncbi:hypothetical protein [Hirschia baltica]|uniref:Lipoprotein n=1 Tax=Hirschia baltica (strain ATCC 49814 / DSM 5838 / IFAM 1418) TaxID=582402 RepID=C6XN05_HIRBI|nr:hypothetical protein [Hirschia baltica]ACT58175.1 hypothetical protein Hbal_0473 [Hirschia baltica ATCC 49814]
MGLKIHSSAFIAVLTSMTLITGCATTNTAILPHSVPSLYGPTAADMPSNISANQERCAAIFEEIDSLNAKLDLAAVDEDKGIFKPAKFNRGEVRRAYLMGLARGIPCPKTSLEATIRTSGGKSQPAS